MSVDPNQDRCIDCKILLPGEGPCPNCGSTKRIKNAGVDIRVTPRMSADAKVIIGWQEVDRLLDKNEYAAALLVAAVNVEFILWQNLRHLSPASPPSKKTHYSEWKTWQTIEDKEREFAWLGSLIQVAQFFTARKE